MDFIIVVLWILGSATLLFWKCFFKITLVDYDPQDSELEEQDHDYLIVVLWIVWSVTLLFWKCFFKKKRKVYFPLDKEMKELEHRDLISSLENIFNNGIHSDFAIITKTETFNVHKCILSAKSSEFRAMLTANWDKRDINIPDISADTMREMLRYIYCGQCSKLDFDAVPDLFSASDKYNVGLLKTRCSNRMVGGLTAHNAVRFLLLADRHGDSRLQLAAVRFIAKNMTEIQKRTEWVDLFMSHPKLVKTVVETMAKAQT